MENLNRNLQILPENKAEYSERIWRRAEEFALIRQALEQKIAELEELFAAQPLESLNLHQKDRRTEEEKEYWDTKGKISEIKLEEDKLEKLLLDLEENRATQDEINSVVPKETIEEEKLSKKKQRILKEKTKLGIDPREIMAQMYGEFGAEKMRLTTGRHATGVKNLGSMDPISAAAEFYYRTTDTHGGKVAHGKKGNQYVSPSGKRIRKS